MMKLSRDEIKFIDTYLQSSDVVYVDIRQEMVDHIATAIEEKMQSEQHDFYNAFKQYMAINKKDILKSNKQRGSFSLSTIVQFFLFLGKPQMLIFGVLFYGVIRKVDVNQYFSEEFTINNLFFVLVLTAAIFQQVYMKYQLKKQFYKVEKVSQLLVLIYFGQFFFFPIFSKTPPSAIILTIFSFLFFGYVSYFIQELIKFNRQQISYLKS
ncbi:hypothetical protein [Flavobacterium sp.]|uniref:hypothetical protein n=1 Tax=Flavobacterium sp. TaxID=239 RepID=UPI00391C43C3